MRIFLRVLAAMAAVSALTVPATAQARDLTTASASVAGQLQAVSCINSRNCWAVGTLNPGPLTGSGFIEHWTGSAWHVVRSQNPPAARSSELDGIACAGIRYCWAVGYYQTAGVHFHFVPYAERFNGRAWSYVAMPYPGSQRDDSDMRAVSCPAVGHCFAVGGFSRSSGFTVSLIERLTGRSWRIVTNPALAGSNVTGLEGLSCTSPRDCWATGQWLDYPKLGGALADHWDGRRWTAVRVQTASYRYSGALYAVSCQNRAMCMAIGSTSTGLGSPLTPYVERWNGRAWLPAPIGISAYVTLMGVSCAPSGTCMAVGWLGYPHSTGATLVEHWNGTSWATLPSPNPPGTRYPILSSVSCPRSTDCWAVGDLQSLTGHGTAVTQVLIEHWNGTTWTVAAS